MLTQCNYEVAKIKSQVISKLTNTNRIKNINYSGNVMGTPEMISDYGTTPRVNNKETDDDEPN